MSSSERPANYLASLAHELCALPRETEWVEFKTNESDPDTIGEYVSALANSAALQGKAFGYLVWGVHDADHAIVGTTFDPHAARKGNEELESWLLRLLEPKIDFRFDTVEIEDQRVVLLEIGRATRHPVRFSGQEFIRVGTYKKKLKDFPEKERALWRIFDAKPFEDGVALSRATSEAVLRLLDYPAYFDLLELPLPSNQDQILGSLAQDRLIRRGDAGGWEITNLGAILFAKRLDNFGSLKRKAVRVVQYRGSDRTEALKEQEGTKGYASGFERLIAFINALLPANEVVGQALRKNVPMFPELAVRELVANALIHQDLFATGTGPMVEIFGDRVEVTNPGAPLVDTRRFVDTPPRSRNEALASLMRRFRICEERGSGIDKVVFQVELFQLPAPLFERFEDSTRATLFAQKPLARMSREERIRACYLHGCLRYVMRQPMTNTSLRERFGIAPENSSTASRLLNEAVEAGLLMIVDPRAGTRSRSYLPFWAAPSSDDVGGVVA